MSQQSVSPEKLANRVIELHGGREAFLAHTDSQINDLNSRWNQDAAMMGRILRSHLFVEHYLTSYLQARNPRLGSLDSARLTFSQKAELVGANDARVAYLIPGVRRLNKIRNRMAHTLSASITAEDRESLLSVDLFRALRDALSAPAIPSTDPVDVLESFSQHAGVTLQAASDPKAGYWVQSAGAEPRDGF